MGTGLESEIESATMQSKSATITEYLRELPPDRRKAIRAIRKVIKDNLPRGYIEIWQNGAIGYVVPHSIYPSGYHCDPSQPLPFVGLASQKNHMGLYLFCLYTEPVDEKRFREAWFKSGKKLDMGKSCVRFKKLEDVPLEVVAQAIKRVPVKKFIASYEAGLAGTAAGKRPTKNKAAKKKSTKTVAKQKF